MASKKKSKKPAASKSAASKPAKKASKSPAKSKKAAISQQLAAQRLAIERGRCPSCFKANKTSFKLCAKCRTLKRTYMQRLRAERAKSTKKGKSKATSRSTKTARSAKSRR